MKDMVYDICLLMQEGFSDTLYSMRENGASFSDIAIMELYGVTSSDIDYIRSHYYGGMILGDC